MQQELLPRSLGLEQPVADIPELLVERTRGLVPDRRERVPLVPYQPAQGQQALDIRVLELMGSSVPGIAAESFRPKVRRLRDRAVQSVPVALSPAAAAEPYTSCSPAAQFGSHYPRTM